MKSSKLLSILYILFLSCVVMAAASSAQDLATLVNFNFDNGDGPFAALIRGNDGNLYGTTVGGGNSYGIVYKITPGGTISTIYTFCSQLNCADGSQPWGGLLQASDHNFYGTTEHGGAHLDKGTVFKLTPSGTLATLYSFCAQPGCTDGSNPRGGLVEANDGNLYGTTQYGGAHNQGVLYRITPTGTMTTLYNFCSLPSCNDGANPMSALVLGSDGNLYGTTDFGAYGGGTLFKATTRGTLTTMHAFCSPPSCSDGSNPIAALIQASDGNFYGTTTSGGNLSCGLTDGCGTLFRITPTGTLTTLHTFCSEANCPDGAKPYGALVEGNDGNFYGTTDSGGLYRGGTLFRIKPSGLLTTMHTFCSEVNCTDGRQPESGLLQTNDGLLYGTTFLGGRSANCRNGCGTVYHFSTSPPAKTQFLPVTPCRLVDTRPEHGGGGPIPGNSYQTFYLPDLAQSKNCEDLSSADAYSLNLTLVPVNGAPLSYVTIWPAGEGQPRVSIMNSLDGRVKASAAIIPAGARGGVSVYATNTTNIVLDVDGYFKPPGQTTLTFYPVIPCRVADTRRSDFPPGLGAPQLPAGTARDFPIMESPCIPQGVDPQAYSLNVTVVPYPNLGHGLGYLELWPTGEKPQSPVSTLNNPTGTIVANAAILSAGAAGQISALASGETHLLIDINGYFASPGNHGLSFYRSTPCRVIDTRNTRDGLPFTGQLTVDVVDSACALPSTAQGYVFNVTVPPSGSLGYLTLWANGQDKPLVSTLNAADGLITSNMAIVPTTNGFIDAFAAGYTHLIMDITGYFAP